MDMEDRRSEIVSLVNREGSVSLTQLKVRFPDVSETTLRTDLKVLDGQRLIIRVHGGAKSVGFAIGTDDLLVNRSARRSQEKLEIANKAVRLIRENTTIYMDSGSSTTALASVMPDLRLYVFTNSLTVANELARLEKVTTYIVGGRLNISSMSTAGGTTIEKVSTLGFDQLFLGVTGLTRHAGFTCGSDDEAVLKRTLVQNASDTVVLMDSSKVGRQFTFPICRLGDVDTVVTDAEGLGGELPSVCSSAGVTLL
jgi:DeoR family transcriptional regulator of aga operon